MRALRSSHLLAALTALALPTCAHANLSHLSGGWSTFVVAVIAIVPPLLLLPVFLKGKRLLSWVVVQAVWLGTFGLYLYTESLAFRPFTVDPNDPAFKKGVQDRLEAMKREESAREECSWFGKTGLSEEDERELPRYLRREFGMLLSSPGALKAADLEYLGVFAQGVETVRYWRINHGSAEPKFAYVVSAPDDRQVMGWGDRAPAK
jgi:hypothetical protein